MDSAGGTGHIPYFLICLAIVPIKRVMMVLLCIMAALLVFPPHGLAQEAIVDSTRDSRQGAGGDVVPSPDPTELTTVQLNREINALKEIIFTRINAMDKALTLFQNELTRSPTEVDKQISHLKSLHEEKFEGVSLQFNERDTRTEQSARDSKVAVDAALQAAKEAVAEQNKSNTLAIAKNEAAITKQIDQMLLMIQAAEKATTEKISDVKDRVGLIEGKDTGLSMGWGIVVGVIGLIVGFLSIFSFMRGRPAV